MKNFFIIACSAVAAWIMTKCDWTIPLAMIVGAALSLLMNKGSDCGKK